MPKEIVEIIEAELKRLQEQHLVPWSKGYYAGQADALKWVLDLIKEGA